MTSSVRKLAFDLGFRWLLPVQILFALVADMIFLRGPDLSGAFATGIVLSLQATATYNKVGLWRTLPVTNREIGRARWWQMTGLPGIGIFGTMGLALALHTLMMALGWDWRPVQADAMATVRCLLLQFFYPAFLTLFSLAMTFARITRSPLAWVAVIATGLPWLLLLPHAIPGTTVDMRILALGLIGLAAAAVLYVTAPHWPLPVTQPLHLELNGNRSAISGHAGQRGWLTLCAMASLRSVSPAAIVLALYIAAILALRLDSILVMQMEFFTVVILLLQVTVFNATALRALRILPGSTLTLTAYLFLLPLALVAAWICLFSLALVPWLTGDPAIIDLVALSAALFASALALPAALAVRQTAVSLIIISSVALMGLVQFAWVHLPTPWHDERLLAALTALAVFVGFVWVYRQIGRGSRIYRHQPFIPARWRGQG
ncbi:MAG TPA: hypothetical protein VHC39_09975 [Rhizomicrobium sp.]|nr:hypothetical protein [Rhizomicrobium sp.]